MTSRRLSGRALHGGATVSVVLERREGPIAIAQGDRERRLDELTVIAGDRATVLRDAEGALRVSTIEHLLSAFAGLGVHDGVRIVVDGPELPVLDGGSVAFCEALRAIEAPRGEPRVRVLAAGSIELGRSRYDFAPGPSVDVAVELEWSDARLVPRAAWAGDENVYIARIAPARTFAFASEVEALAERGLGQGVDPESVVVVGETILCSGRPFEADEPARHKLLDLLGDLYVHGGPPRGRVLARRPGHGVTHRAIAEARARGLVG